MAQVAKRNNGAGSIFRRKDGRWVAQVWDPIKQRSVQKYAPTQKAARELQKQMLDHINQGMPAADIRASLKSHCNEWALERARRRRSDNTVRSYRERIFKYALPTLGNKLIGDITVADLERLFDSLKAQGLGHSSIKGLKNALAAMYSDAVRDRLLGTNPARAAQLPLQAPRQPQKAPPTSEIVRLVKAAAEAPPGAAREVGCLMQFLVFTGARIGEALTAMWSDIDTQSGIWTVQRTLTKDLHGNPVVGAMTKTGDIRNVPLSPMLISLLTEHKQAVAKRRLQSTIWGDHDFVFPNATGSFRDPSNMRHAVKRYFPFWNRGFHVIRHWFISLGLTDSGVSAAQIARLVGHAKTSTTTDIYGSLMSEGGLRVIRNVEAALHGDLSTTDKLQGTDN